jgi:sugar phosphate isomerase/epimerase
LHPRLSVDQLCFPGASLDEFVTHCRALDAHTVVLTSPQLLVEGGAERARTSLAGGPRVEAVNHLFAGYPDLADDDGRAAAMLARLLPVAADLGAHSVYLLTGSRGRLSWAQAADRFLDLVADGAALAADLGLRLMLETANSLYADIHIAHTFADTIALAERADLGVCVELQFCWAEADLDALLRRVVPRAGLVQVSDYVPGDRVVPGRAVPGDGCIPLAHIVAVLLAAGYEGMFDLELLGPRIDDEGHEAAVVRGAAAMTAILTAVGA